MAGARRIGRRRASGLKAISSLSLAAAIPASLPAQDDLPVQTQNQRIGVPVTSFLEMRERNLVRQGWDVSCGAAALSTVLTHHFDAPYSEATIAVSILANTDPERVKERGGFSLLDLKRFAEAVGFSATGYAELTLEDLADSGGPVIIPVRIRGLDHFVVFRGLAAEKVLIGDPAFGNLILSEERFAGIWTSGIGFFVEPDDASSRSAPRLSAEAMHLTVPDLNFVYRIVTDMAIVPPTRR